MDIELARTFLAIVETGNFNRAAARLDVTQSTVSMRIRALEDSLGRPLFQRTRVGAHPTAAGQQFWRYAATLVRAWEQARQEIALPPEFDTVLAIGSQFTLWDRFLVKWIPWMRKAAPTVAIKAEIGLSDGLMGQLAEGLLDVGVMYTPQSRPGLVIEELLHDPLVLVASEPDNAAPYAKGYVYVDWGPEFRTSHGNAFPDLATPALSVSHGPLGLQHILENGGSGYFPLRSVREFIDQGRLVRVADAPQFMRPAHVAYPAGREDEPLKTALQGLRWLAAQEAGEDRARETAA